MSEAFITTRSRQKPTSSNARGRERETNAQIQEQLGIKTLETEIEQALEPSNQKDSELLWTSANNTNPIIHITMDKELRREFRQGYQDNVQFKTIYKETNSSLDSCSQGCKFMQGEDKLLYFLNADFQPQLCILKKLRQQILEEAHESPMETVHLQMDQLWYKLSSKFYWKRMKIDIEQFCKSCDVCQKTKTSNFNKFGLLILSPIPTRPYESVSMDLIVDLPWSNNYNAILVVVDQLSKHAQFVPTTTGLNAEAFGALFVKEVISRFGLPSSIISD